MFSFIKWFGEFIENAKKRKGLWFTTLTVISLIGIFLSMYFVSFLVSDVAEKTYENQKTQFELRLKNQVNLQKERALAIAATITMHDELKSNFITYDQNSTDNIKRFTTLYNDRITKMLDTKDFSVAFERTEKFAELKMVNGLVVNDMGVTFKASVPFVKTDESVSNVVVNESMNSLVNVFKSENRDFVFMLNESSINVVDRNIKKAQYQRVFDDYYIKTEAYQKGFVDIVKMLDYQKLMKNGYLKDNNYFYVMQKVFDVEGDEIGVAILAENMSASNSFVNLVKNLVNSVTIVALGLIISMILFLF